MAKTKTRKKKANSGGYAKSKYRKAKTSNPGRRRRSHGGVRHRAKTHYRRIGNPGLSNVGPMVTNAVFVIVGALGSKLGAQAVLGTNNVGLVGYAGNAAAGGVLWFLTEKVMKNRSAASGVLAGTIVQIVLRLINDYTPFGQYVSQLGMGDYQMQSFVTPQVLVDPWRNAEIAIPPGWAPRSLPPAAASPAQAMTAGVSGLGGGGDLYGASSLY